MITLFTTRFFFKALKTLVCEYEILACSQLPLLVIPAITTSSLG